MAEPGSDLQFDRAQFEAPAPTACAFCAQPLSGSYFEVNGRMACERCRYKAEEEWNSGSGMVRFLKAAAFGIGAGIVGALVYWGIAEAFEIQLSLISIAVGWLVGVGVRAGSQGRGGWLYQLLAVFLTYTSIVASYAPSIVREIREGAQKADAQAAPASTAAATTPTTTDKEKPSAVQLIVGAILLTVLVYASPFLIVVGHGNGQGVMGLVIIGIGLWQAWSVNRKATLEIAGPFSLSKAPVPDPAA
jgi:hypothetical protein